MPSNVRNIVQHVRNVPETQEQGSRPTQASAGLWLDCQLASASHQAWSIKTVPSAVSFATESHSKSTQKSTKSRPKIDPRWAQVRQKPTKSTQSRTEVGLKLAQRRPKIKAKEVSISSSRAATKVPMARMDRLEKFVRSKSMRPTLG